MNIKDQIEEVLKRFGPAYDGEEGLLYPPEEHVKAATTALLVLLDAFADEVIGENTSKHEMFFEDIRLKDGLTYHEKRMNKFRDAQRVRKDRMLGKKL